MPHTSSKMDQDLTPDYQAVFFNTMPGNHLILQPNPPHYTVLAISDDMLHVTGQERHRVVGNSFFEVFPESFETVAVTGPSNHRATFQDVVKNKNSVQMPTLRHNIPSSSGIIDERYWSAMLKPVLNPEGEVLYILHSTVDVTDQIKSAKREAALRKAEKNYNLFMQAPFEVCILTGPDNVVEMANDNLLALWGKNTDIIGKPLLKSVPELREQGFPKLLDEVRKTGEPSHATEYPTSLHIDGKEVRRYYNFVYQPYYENPGDKVPAGVLCTAYDVTEQVVARKKIKESEQQVRSFVDSAPFPIAVYIGKEKRIQFANQAMIDAYRKGNNVVGRLYEDVMSELSPEIHQRLDMVLATGVPFHAKNERIDIVIDGKQQTFFFNYHFTPLFDVQGKVYGVMNTAVDVTDIILAKNKIKESKSRFRSLVQQAPVPITLTRGHDAVIESINAPMLRIMGKKEEEVMGKRLVEALPELKDQPILEIAEKVVKTGEPFHEFEVPVSLQACGKLEERHINISYTPFVEEGVITGLIHVAVDVTEQVVARKIVEDSAEALKRFKFMADLARDAFILMRKDGSFAYLNHKALEEWDYRKEEAQHIRVPDVDPVYQEEMFSQLFARAQEETIPQFETLHKRRDGSVYPVDVNVVGLMLGEEPHLFAIARDITQRKKIEMALELKNGQLVRINNDLDNFIYTASHDLKAPISNIEGLLALLSDDFRTGHVQEGETQHIMALMQESVERFKMTIESLTDVVKLQQESDGETVLINLPEVIREVSLDLQPMINLFGVRLEVNVADCPLIRFSAKNMRSVVYNLLSNAIKYRSQERVPQIRIRCQSTDEHHVLIVEDNGLGIVTGRTYEVFTMFKRFHDHVEGTGIGLYMVKKMMDNAGGRIEVESQLDIGTIFRAYFRK